MNPKLVYCVIQLLEGLGMGSFFPIYTPWLELHGLNFLKMGVVNFFYHASVTILDPFTGFIADRFGKKRTFIIGQILWTATQYIYGASSQITGFLLAEGVAAIGNSLKSDALESWLQNKLGKTESAKIMGQSRILFTVGQVSTSILAGYISVTYGMQIAWFVSGTFFLLATILGNVTLFLTSDDLPESSVHVDVSMKQIFSLTLANKTIVTSMLLISVYSFVSKPVFMYWPQIIAALSMPPALRGWSILAMSLPAMVGSLLAGHDRFFTRDKNGLYRVLTAMCLGLAVAGLANNLPVFFAGLIIVEIAYGAVRIVVYGHLYDEVDPQHRSTVNSMVSAVQTLGGAISLLVMGELADLFSPQVTLVIGSVLVLFVLLYALKIKVEKLL